MSLHISSRNGGEIQERVSMQRSSDLLAGRYANAQLTVERADGPHLFDAAGTPYVDFILGNLTQLMGHRAVTAEAELRQTIGRFVNVGDQKHALGDELASTILTIARKASLRFTNSGSEAAHLAIRLARARAGRSKIVKFVGHYHGWFNEELASFLPASVSLGIPESTREHTLAVPWNDAAAVLEVFELHGKDIAAVICEPCLAHAGTIPPQPGFLQLLRSITQQYGASLIFDECITGFRIALGGAQDYFGCDADCVIYSKAISNGVPIGVVAGTEEFMAAISDWRVWHASTYDGNPISVSMASLVIRELRQSDALRRIQQVSEALVDGLRNIFEMRREPVLLQTCGGFFSLYFTDQPQILDYAAAMATDYARYRRFAQGMLAHRIIVSEGELGSSQSGRNWIGSWFPSSAHDPKIVQTVLDGATRVAQTL
jgi:glutamate-1-semialdehyde 2,1-aminomutase